VTEKITFVLLSYREMVPEGYRLIDRLVAEELKGEDGDTWPCERVDACMRHFPETVVERCRQAVAVLVARPCAVRAHYISPNGQEDVIPVVVRLRPGMNILVWCVDDMSRSSLGTWSLSLQFDFAPLRGVVCTPGGASAPGYQLEELGESLLMYSYPWHRHAVPPIYVMLDADPMPPPLTCLARAAAGEESVTCADPEEFPSCLGEVTYMFVSFMITNCPLIFVTDVRNVSTRYPYEIYDGDSLNY